jgi:hypothetical protein
VTAVTAARRTRSLPRAFRTSDKPAGAKFKMNQIVELDAGWRATTASYERRTSLFSSAWWLDAASNGTYETVTTTWDNRVTGSLSFTRVKRLGMISLRMPRYTRTLGPMIEPPPSKPVQRAANIRRIVRELVAALPAHDDFRTTLDPTADPGIAFAFDVARFHAIQAFTFRIAPGAGMMWSDLDYRTRNTVRAAQKRLTVRDSTDFDRFERLSRAERQGGANNHDFPALRRLFDAALCRGQAMVRFAVQDDGTDAAAVILVWDDEVMHYWVCARNRAAADCSGANALLLWESICTAQARGLIFDADGYCSPNSARFLAGFAGEPVVRPVISRSTCRYRLAKMAESILG